MPYQGKLTGATKAERRQPASDRVRLQSKVPRRMPELTMSKPATAALAGAFVLAGGFAVAAVAGAFAGPTPANAQASPAETPVIDSTGTFTPEEQAAILQMIEAYVDANPGFVRDYLLENPEVIQEAVTELERRRVAQESERQAAAIESNRDVLTETGNHAVLGNPDGDVTLVEFFDYNCTYCRRTLDDILQLLDEDPGLRIVLKEFPVLGAGSTEAAQVAAAVDLIAPDRYQEFHSLLLNASAQADGDLAIAAAAEIGITEDEILAVKDTPQAIAYIQESYDLADQLSINATPTFVLGNEVIVGAVGYDNLRSMVDSVRNCGATVC